MNKYKLLIGGWVLILLALIFIPKLVDRMQPRIIEVEIKVPVIKEKIVEKIVYKEGKEIIKVEKEVIKYKPTNVGSFTIKALDNNDMEYSLRVTGCSRWSITPQKDCLVITKHKQNYTTVTADALLR